MSLTKKYLKSKPVCKVTFKVAKEECNAAEKVAIAGDFNSWQETPMKKLKSGDFTVTLDLETDSKYQFRYKVNEESWENDWAADEYIPSPVSLEDNSVVVV
ncbi:MAG: isoamylase early set domain-containing protein [Gammaproteobacteria bacterium]|nr:isoamylase early set domain-containing protein [Gammaproteobacteria bacterium]